MSDEGKSEAQQELEAAKAALEEAIRKGELPTLQLWEAAGNQQAHYQPFLEAWQTKRAEEVLKEAEKKSKSSVKLVVKGKAGQATYLLPCKAPLKDDGHGGRVPNLPPEPGIRVPCGKVVSIPVRDEAHRACLSEDPNVEIVDPSLPTGEEEDAIAKKAVEDARAKAQQGKKK